jgi:hypothetical protein
MGITGEEIRREQAESRRRSKLGVATPTSVRHAIGGGVHLAWSYPICACYLADQRLAALVLSVVALSLAVLTHQVVTIRSVGEQVQVSAHGLVRGRKRKTELVIDQPELRYWSAWLCHGYEVRGRNASVIVVERRRTPVEALAGVRSVRVASPSWRYHGRMTRLNLLSALLELGSIALLASAEKSLLFIMFGISSMATSLVCAGFGAPRFELVSHQAQ